jgi:hypothetical protein
VETIFAVHGAAADVIDGGSGAGENGAGKRIQTTYRN